MNILHIDASARREASMGRRLSRRVVERLVGVGPEHVVVTRRDADASLPLLTEALLGAVMTPAADRDAEQAALAVLPDRLIDELEAADAVVIGVPIYNFGIPAALKAWVDLVARARRTFRYSESGPVGLLKDRPVYLVVTSGGTRLDSAIDFATPYLRQVLGFLGLRDIRVIDATANMADQAGTESRAAAAIDALPLLSTKVRAA